MKKKIFNKIINLHIDRKLLNRLESYSKEKNWRRSQVIREAVKEYLDRRENESQN